MQMFINVLYIAVCAGLVTLILSQKKPISSGALKTSDNSNTYWGKNKSRSSEGKQATMIKIGIAIYFAFTMAITLFL